MWQQIASNRRGFHIGKHAVVSLTVSRMAVVGLLLPILSSYVTLISLVNRAIIDDADGDRFIVTGRILIADQARSPLLSVNIVSISNIHAKAALKLTQYFSALSSGKLIERRLTIIMCSSAFSLAASSSARVRVLLTRDSTNEWRIEVTSCLLEVRRLA